jgi:hypothetical protein
VQAKAGADLKRDITAGSGKMKAEAVTDAQATGLVASIRTPKQ